MGYEEHGHAHGLDRLATTSATVGRLLWITVGVCGVAVALGLIVLWPSEGAGRVVDPSGLDADPVAARVVSAEETPCSFDPLLPCVQFVIVPSEGDRAGERLPYQDSSETPIEVGDDILVLIDDSFDGEVFVSFYDFRRSTPMLLLTLLFVVAILVFGRWRGLGALAGLVMSLAVIIVFALPAVLEGRSAVAVALVAAGTIAFFALFLAHGLNPATATALLSTLASLALTGLLAWLFVEASNFTGLTDESVGYLDALGVPIDPRGLLLAGIVIGSLGVLDDVTVTQVSAVWELERAAPGRGPRALYERGVRIGRDHISSTVDTLFLAYAGAALPLLLLFREAGPSIGSVATREVVAIEIVRALVGSIGLIASVPIATSLAAIVVSAGGAGARAGDPADRDAHEPGDVDDGARPHQRHEHDGSTTGEEPTSEPRTVRPLPPPQPDADAGTSEQ